MGFYLTEQLPGNSLENSDNPHTLYRGLQLSGLRYYNPELGRWVNRDPIGEWGGLGLYTYVENKPERRVDPLGLLATAIKAVWDLYQDAAHARDIGLSFQAGSLSDIFRGGESVEDFGASSYSGLSCEILNAQGTHEYCPRSNWFAVPGGSPEIERFVEFNAGSGDSSDGWTFVFKESAIQEELTCVRETCKCACTENGDYKWSCRYAGPGSTHRRKRIKRSWYSVGGVVVTPPEAL